MIERNNPNNGFYVAKRVSMAPKDIFLSKKILAGDSNLYVLSEKTGALSYEFQLFQWHFAFHSSSLGALF